MINYSISLRANPGNKTMPKKAYANAQCTEIMTLEKFAEHISNHNSKYNRADIRAPEQCEQLLLLLMKLKKLFPEAKICGHKDMTGSIPKQSRLILFFISDAF